MKKSLSQKLNKFRTSPLIMAVAIIEVILLVCVSTFAWFVFAENNQVETGMISVEPDSGLEIDFNDANTSDYVNIWNYLNEFQFEPVTSLDGRNIFIPTTGTFNSVNTSNMVFREATVNDMNSKYICVDFTLSNTHDTEDMDVYLNSQSYFKFNNNANGKALRLAFYQNDGSSGAITSSLLSKEYDGEEPTEPPTEKPTEGEGDTQATFMIYFDTKGSAWDQVWIETDHTANLPGNTNRCFKMTKHPDYDTIYYIDLRTLITGIDDSILTFIKFRRDPNSNDSTYTSVQLPEHDIYHNYLYSFKLNSSGNAYPGSYNSGYGMLLNETPSTFTGDPPNVGGDDSGEGGSTEPPTEAPTTPEEPEEKTTVYFNNTLGWKQPYAYIWRENGNNDEPLSAWPGKPMTHISGSIYYYTFSSKYDSIIFNDGNSQGGAVKTGDIHPVKDGYIYMIGAPNASNSNIYDYTVEDYIGSVDGGTYPVISPGVSTGFQRPYAPVTQIDNNSGSAQVVVPAFASSIDDYNYGQKKLFTIKAGQTLSLSMIVWLEGTDPDCTADVYAGKDIDMNLIFATKDSGEDMYTYRFLDKTKENWIDDRITTDTGVSFKPVMQLYDVDNQKGYQMTVSNDSEGKPTVWSCSAPQNLIKSTHIMFRRVNPMNEDEVWNYWDTYGFANTEYGAVNNGVVTFSAFSDGAPTNAEKDANATTEPNAPARSCGGLWGEHETKIVTVYDGTKDQWIKNSNVEGTTSVLTMNYTYKGQTVEYKASGATDKGMYYFVVPDYVYSSSNSERPTILFKRYYNFNDKHALNSNLNSLTYHMAWAGNQCMGDFFEITGNDSSNGYWGSDILYIQAKNAVKSKIDGSHLQVHFYSTSDGSEVSGTSKYVTLYQNNYYAAKDDGYGYACVVPSDKKYYKYRVERCNPDNTSEKWNITPLQSITTVSSETEAPYTNTVSKNICSIDYLFLKVYLECSTSYCGDSWDPEIYVFKEGGGNEKAWPGTTMTWSKNGTEENSAAAYKQYEYQVNISSFDRMIFSNDYDYGAQRRQTGDITIGADDHVSGMIYQWDGSNQRWRSTRKSGVTQNETLHATLYNTDDWE